MSAEQIIPAIGKLIEIIGIAVLIAGALMASGAFVIGWRSLGLSKAFNDYRANLGRAILLGLEFLVAADIIATVAIDPTLESVAVLAAIVLVRTFLSFALEVEIDGKWPWRKAG